MKVHLTSHLALAACAVTLASCAPATESDALPSWNESAAKANILALGDRDEARIGRVRHLLHEREDVRR